ncbi:UDP-N-acetylmuramoyl-tripeptide--D-alanyl-D-alanine ligase [Novosphingobium soli]|uniref:Mur ligase family protein n=1 Tax=Novosphingobium soli TaxID=574956 RepID=A0ABV6CV56_9SPHN
MSVACRPALEALRKHLAAAAPVMVDGAPGFVLFFSFTDGTARATVLTVTAETLDAAWKKGLAQLPERAADTRWLRIDWVDAVERTTWQALRQQLRGIKRNYFRLGISLDARFQHAFLETELNANAMLYGGPGEAAAVINEKNFAIYAARRHGLKALRFLDEEPVWLFTTRGVFRGEDGTVHALDGGGLDTGRRSVGRLNAPAVESLIAAGSRYLAAQVQEDGRFHYGWHPCFDRPIPSYNALRHASSLYAMLEAWEVTRDALLEKAIAASLDRLTGDLIKPVVLPTGETAAFLVDVAGEIKLGGNAVAILALAKHAELTGDHRHMIQMEALAEGILHMQDPGSGRFVHVLAYPDLSVRQEFRIIYYDGEAAFALMRLYRLTGNLRWLEAVESAFEHFIREEHWKAHDHWLSYCVDELTRHRPDERYYRFAIDNFRDHLGFVLERITTFPTLLELMMAAHRTVARLRSDPQLSHVLDGVDLARFYRALHHRAHYLLNGHFWPELAMFYANPAKIVGSFFIRHHAFRVRIDDVEHYLSGLVAYRAYLLDEDSRRKASPCVSQGDRTERHWTQADVERATAGIWAVPPLVGWQATGLCISPPTMQAGEMVAVRLADPGIGVSPERFALLRHVPSALIVTDAEKVAGTGLPILQVEDVGAAILALGHYARERMAGKLVGVTGSAGKTTTVAMMAHALSAFGAVGQTRQNANLPHGVAWNLASIPWDTPHTVLEMAIGRMARNARMARPDIAIFTNILPAHLEYHRDLATVATRKSAIFDGMGLGGVAVLNRDMAEWERVHMAAKARGLRIVHYGRSEGCDARLTGYDAARREVSAVVGGRALRYRLGAAGEHMALNSLAVLAAVEALGKDIAPVLDLLASFGAAEGRGREIQLELGERRLTLIDDAYNANPGSMEAALAVLGGYPAPGRRVAVLGEMLELGEHASAYHTGLAPLIARHGIDRVHAMGELYEGLWDAVPCERRGSLTHSLDALKDALTADLRDGDLVLLKGSHGTGMHTLPAWLQAHQPRPVRQIQEGFAK